MVERSRRGRGEQPGGEKGGIWILLPQYFMNLNSLISNQHFLTRFRNESFECGRLCSVVLMTFVKIFLHFVTKWANVACHVKSDQSVKTSIKKLAMNCLKILLKCPISNIQYSSYVNSNSVYLPCSMPLSYFVIT